MLVFAFGKADQPCEDRAEREGDKKNLNKQIKTSSDYRIIDFLCNILSKKKKKIKQKYDLKSKLWLAFNLNK